MKLSIVNPLIPVFQRGLAFRKTRRWQPLSMATVAAWAVARGIEVQFIDAHALGLDDAEVVRQVGTFLPDVLLYSSERTDAWEIPIPDTGYVERFFSALAAAGGLPPTVLIEGPHGSLFPDDLLRRIPAAQAILRGETEPVAFAALDALERGRGLEDVPSVSWRRRDGTIAHNAQDPAPPRIGAFPTPAWHLLPMQRYFDLAAPGVPFAILETSRGCPMPCGYCYKQMFGERQAKRDPARVIDELAELVDRYGVRRLFFQDQIFTLDRAHAAAVCSGLIDRGLHRRLEWRCQTRLNGMKRELLDLMKAAGCREIHTGLESGSDSMQARISKLTLDEFLEFRAYGETIGLRISPNVMLGLPGETEETALESARFFHRLGLIIPPVVAFTYPGTRYYREAVERGELEGDGWTEVATGAARVGTGLGPEAVERLRRRAELLNHWLRVKRRVWRMLGREHGTGAARRMLLARGKRGRSAAPKSTDPAGLRQNG